MAGSEYGDWLARGRAHQAHGRAIDAMLCYRRALRAEREAFDARFHLGEVLWQLGRVPDAIAAWRDGVAVNAGHLAPNLALAEALLATADAPGAVAAAESALRIAPDNPRARAVAAVAGLLRGDGVATVPVIAALVERDPQLLATPTIAGPLALALDLHGDAAGRDEFLAALAQSPATLAGMPPLLLALVAERVAREPGDARATAALVAVCLDRAFEAASHDALRRIALALAGVDASAGSVLAARYALLCAGAFAAPVPLSWPRRSAGERTRIVVLLPPTPPVAATQALLRALASLPRADFDLAAATIGAASADSAGDARGDAYPVGTLGEAAPVVALPAQPDGATAMALAARDPDVLLDFAGLAAAAAPLLAQRPARAVWTADTVVHANVAPLVDRRVADADALVAALAALHAGRDPHGGCALDAAALSRSWEEAVRTHQGGDRGAARTAYARVLELQPGFAPAHYLRGLAARDDGDLAAARADFAAAIAAAPLYVDARLAAARAAGDAQEPEAAAALCTEGLERASAHVALWRTLGLAQLQRRDGSAAADAFERALALQPDDGETHYNHGVALQILGRLADAARAYQRALAFSPNLTAAEFNLGVLFQEQGATEAAIKAYESVLKANPRNANAYKNLGEVLLGAGRIDAWLANFGRFEANCPRALPLAVQALEACQYRGDFAGVERYLDGLRREEFRADDELQLADCLEELLTLLLYFDVDAEMLLKFAQTYDATAKRVYGAPLPRPARRRPGRLRVGYLSADLRNHVMGKMMWQAIAGHDRGRFELFLYSLAKDGDEWTERFRGAADRFEVLAGLPERAAALRIAEDDVDVLVDLSTHTKGAKPGILAFKPARVQITHVASAGTVGLSAVDYKLTDRYADVPESQAFQLEALLAMDGCVFPYRHIPPAPEHPFHRAALGIDAEAVVIGAFVNGLKLSRRCLALWRDVLQRIPRARLAFSPANPALRALYVRLAAAAGIPAERLLFLPQGRDDAQNQSRYAVVDLVLDTMPYGGVNGTLEALDMGVPVVTQVGRRHGERTSYSILANLGVPELAAQSGREYVELAVRLADDRAFMAAIRARIREGIAHSALTDMVAHTRNLEAAYVAALGQRCPEALAAAQGGDG